MPFPATPLLHRSMTPTRSFNFAIIDETENYLVVDKPPYLLVHPTKPDGPPTLWKELRELLAFEIANGGQVSIVNRLDRETSGLVLVAKTSAAARKFGLLMQKRRLKKGISRHRLGLAGLGQANGRCTVGSARQTSNVCDLAETNDSCQGRTGADGVSCRATFHKIDI